MLDEEDPRRHAPPTTFPDFHPLERGQITLNLSKCNTELMLICTFGSPTLLEPHTARLFNIWILTKANDFPKQNLSILSA